VLKHSVVKIAEFLHTQHSNKLPSLQLPRRDQALLYSHVDAIVSEIETLDVPKGIIALHNGSAFDIGSMRAAISSRRFHEFNCLNLIMSSYSSYL